MSGERAAEALEASARRLAADADAVRLRADALGRSVVGLRWQGAAADSFRRALTADRARLERAAAEVDEAAAALQAHAARVRARLERLRELERAAAQQLADLRLEDLRELADLP